jgi:hypothetical protein
LQHKTNRCGSCFHGYAEGRPRAFIADVRESGLSNVEELKFIRVGGELSPDGYYLAFDTCRKADRALEIASMGQAPWLKNRATTASG